MSEHMAGATPDGSEGLSAPAAAVVDAAVHRYRWPISLVSLGIVLLLATLAGWWIQDVLAPFLNEGEADISDEVTFEASDAKYRVITSGPSRPDIDRTACNIELADGTSRRILGGDGSVTAHQRLGVSRVIEFEAVAGRTTVTCTDRISESFDGGRFQVVRAGGPVDIALRVALAGGLLSLGSGIAWIFIRRRRS